VTFRYDEPVTDSSGAAPSGDHGRGALLDLPVLATRLRLVAGVLAALALVAVVLDGLANGLSFAIMARWAGLFLLTLALAAAGLVAVQALRGADRAQRRGERLSGGDVGLLPPRPPRGGPPRSG
jgi:hypothetical protein